MGYSAPRDFRSTYRGQRAYSHHANSDYWEEIPNDPTGGEYRWKRKSREERCKDGAWALANCLRFPGTESQRCDRWRKYLVDCPRSLFDRQDHIPYWLAPRENGFSPLDPFLAYLSAEEKCNFGKKRLDECVGEFGEVLYCDIWRNMLKYCKAVEEKDGAKA